MAQWNVEFSYNLIVEADTMEQAETDAHKAFDEIMPETDEMNIEVSNYQED